MNVFTPVEKCKTCDPHCGVWFAGKPEERGGRFEVRILGLIPPEEVDGFLVMSDSLPNPDMKHFEVRDGSIQSLAETPCGAWERRIKNMYAAGFRHIYFTDVEPRGMERYDVLKFDPQPVDISA